MHQENDFVKLRSLLLSVTQVFGLKVLRWYPHKEIEKYIAPILEYLLRQLILSGVSDSGIEQKIKLFEEVYSEIMEKIALGDIEYLKKEFRIHGSEDIIFCGALTNFLSLLHLQLMYNYSHLFRKPEPDCHLCNNSVGDNNEEIEFNVIDPRPMNDGYEFGLGTQELWSDEYRINY